MKVKKSAFARSLLGVPLGIAIGFIITIIVLLIIGDGNFHTIKPELAVAFSSELNALILQTVVSALIGAIFGASSVIWDLEDWSLAKQSGIYFLITALTMMPIAWFMHWMPHSLGGVLIYFAIFIGIFIVIWGIQYYFLRRKVKRMNEKLN